MFQGARWRSVTIEVSGHQMILGSRTGFENFYYCTPTQKMGFRIPRSSVVMKRLSGGLDTLLCFKCPLALICREVTVNCSECMVPKKWPFWRSSYDSHLILSGIWGDTLSKSSVDLNPLISELYPRLNCLTMTLPYCKYLLQFGYCICSNFSSTAALMKSVFAPQMRCLLEGRAYLRGGFI